MFTVTTKYDKVIEDNKEVRKKVFMIRGDEAYAKTTNTSISVGEITNTDKYTFTTDITINVYRNVGSSTVILHDGEEVLDLKTIGVGVHEVVFEDLTFSYGVEHKLYAVFKGNSSCLPSKSKTEVLYEEPTAYKTNITKTSGTIYYNRNSTFNSNSLTGTFTVTLGGDSPSSAIPVKLYINDGLIKTYDVTGELEINYSTLPSHTGLITSGEYTVKLVIEETENYYGYTYTYKVYGGFKVEIISYPTSGVIDNGVPRKIVGRVSDWGTGKGVQGVTIYFRNTGGS